MNWHLLECFLVFLFQMEESAKVLTGCVDCCSSLIVSSVATSGSSGSSTS